MLLATIKATGSCSAFRCHLFWIPHLTAKTARRAGETAQCLPFNNEAREAPLLVVTILHFSK